MSEITITPRWCSAPGCMTNIKITKRHFFRFPKEKKRWLQWIKACDRLDLQATNSEYTNLHYRLCHIHFRLSMFRNIEGRLYLSKEAVPSIFLRSMRRGNIKLTDIVQPISFVTVFLKPESKNSFRNSSMDLSDLTQSDVSETHSNSDQTNTIPMPHLQILFPKASIKEYEHSNKLRSLLEVRSENDNGNTLMTKELVKNVRTKSTASITSMTSPQMLLKKLDNREIIDLTSTDSLKLTTLPIIPVTSPQNDIRTLKRKRWHISTQTPVAWTYMDSFLEKRQMEKSEIIESLATKRRKTLCTETADYQPNVDQPNVDQPNVDQPNVDQPNVNQPNVDQLKAKCADLLPRNSALLFSACIAAGDKRKTKRSFEDGQFALRLFLTAPITYQFYRPLCMLPGVHQLRRHIRSWDMPPGLNDNVLDALRLKMKSLPSVERRCCLCVHEMRLQPHLFYNLSRDRIVGFHDIGTEKRCILARKALVMIGRSLAGDWEQPVAYYFHGDACRTGVVKNLIFQAIIRLKSIGATVHALVTGTTPMFSRLSQQLGISAECPSFLVNDERVFYIFDVPRLMRATRNVFMTYELRFCERSASWKDIELFFRRDSQMRLPLAPKLSVSHLEPDEHQRTQTKYAVQVFSSSVAAGLNARIASGEFPMRAIGTMELVYNFDRLFDILNSSAPTKSCDKDFSRAFTGSANEIWFLQSTLDFLKSIRAIDGNGACVKSIKCFDRWRITINGIIQLWDALREHQFPFLRTRRLNREGVEQIFHCIRQRSKNRARPTPILFTRAFKDLVSRHLLEHSRIDSVAGARRMLRLIASAGSLRADKAPPAASPTALSVAVTSYRDIDLRLSEKGAFKRVCEFLLAECLRAHINCDVCVAYAAEDAPGASFSVYVSCLEDAFMRNFERLSTEADLGARMLQFAQQVEYKPPCPDFPVTFLVKLFLRMRIYFTLSRHNKMCNGVESRNYLKVMQL